MKYLLFYFAAASANVWGSSGMETYNPCHSQYQVCIQQDPGKWTAELKNSKAECMDALKASLAPTKAWCIPVNGYTNELVPY